MSEVVIHTKSTQPAVTLSDAALKHVVSYLNANQPKKGIRLSIKKTGCSGLAYVVEYADAPKEGDMELSLTDAYQLWVDKASYPYLKGVQVDYIKQGLNQKLVFNNPNQTGQCGCGESFTVAD